jgi:hypothetical protein
MNVGNSTATGQLLKVCAPVYNLYLLHCTPNAAFYWPSERFRMINHERIFHWVKQVVQRFNSEMLIDGTLFY